ncbi:vWA domain-containing protein [Halomonas stenophila]|uniref:VWFA domain-containing protein n=1 Tax=Halomonas stenophila TaxID=795312 RepID=A0A7W5HI09_9GAMM|nr:vWA domain-containing protein [Halomonas stenophila]MBB3229435.1 hypothetical protein [Halomonas stenophila]
MGKAGRYWRRAAGAALLGLACLLGMVTTAPAQAPEERPDVRVVVDVSGSMRTNDPDRLAVSAMDLLVSLLPEGVSAGVWTFGETVDNPLPLGEVSEDWRERALSLPPALQEYQQYTDIEAALRQAAGAEANGWRHLILMTDGVIDLSPSRGAKPAIDRRSRQRLVEELAPALADQGVAIHAIAFSDEADLALVERLAQLTGGLASVATSPDGLLGAFLDIIERIFPADRLQLEEGRFLVDDGVESLSALIFHDPGASPLTLVAPDGSRYRAETAPDAVRWQVEPRFDLIRIPDPAPGEWRLEGPVGEKSRISVSSPWHLRIAPLPATLYQGFAVPVEAWLARSPGAEAPPTTTLTASLRDLDGEVQASVTLEADDQGRYRGRLPAPALTGNARLVIRAEGEGFARQRSQAVNVLPAIGVAHDPAAGRVVLVAEHPRLNRDNTAIRGDLRGERLEAEAVGEARWHLPLPPLDEALSQPLLLTATLTLDGETRELRLPRLILNPDARVGIGRADMAGPTLAAERFGAADDGAEPARPEPNLADRFVEAVNAAPARLRDWWQAGRPGLEGLAARFRDDPRLWVGLTLAVLSLLVLLLWRRRRRRAVTHSREEPHV